MSTVRTTRVPVLARALIAAVATAATALAGAVALTSPASAHGSVISPPSRNYGCLERWGDNHLSPQMQTEDPMCWQAFQANPNAMWNWNGLYRENLRGNYQAAIPDGTLCSGGHAEGGRYDALDAIGPWHATPVSNNFTVTLYDQASHGADYIRVYVTRQGFDPLTQPLGWGDLELVGEIGYTPASQWRQVQSGVEIDIPVSAPGRTGRHIVYTIWLASHLDQAYFICSDVIFGDDNQPPPPPPSTTAPPPPPPSTTAPPPGSGGCTATYTQVSSWSGGFQGEVQVTAGSSPINGWRVNITFPGGQTIQNYWNATVTPNGSGYVAENASYNGALGAGASATFGFLASGDAGTPTLSCAAS